MNRSGLVVSMAVAGVVGIFGGEALCLAGPLHYEHAIHLACHAILYGGIACVAVAAAIQWGRRRA